MSTLDPAGQVLLDRLTTAAREPGLFAPVPDASGTDSHQSLRLTVDAARRVVTARVLDVDRLRSVDPFVDALHEAFAAADGARALASLERSGRAKAYLARAEETVAGRSPARAPRPPDISRAAVRRRTAAIDAQRRPAHPEPVTSGNGYLTVQRGHDGRLVHVEVDAAWLGAARPEQLERAVVEACRYGTPYGKGA